MIRHLSLAAALLAGLASPIAAQETQAPAAPSGSSPSQGLGKTLEGDAAKALGGGQGAGAVASILGELHQSNATAIQGGKLAEKKGTSSGVKQLAAKVVSDRSAADQEIAALARASGISLPKGSSGAKGGASGLSSLSNLKGNAFDQAFLSWLASRSRNDTAKVKSAQADAQKSGNTGLSALLGKIAPQLESHAQAAQQLARAPSGKGAAATGTGSAGDGS